MLRAPSHIPAGAVSDSLVSQVDFFPTVCDLLSLPAPDWLEGKSLRPVWESPNVPHHEVVYSEVTFHAAFEPKRSVRSRRWNYVRNFTAPHTPILPNCDNGLSKRLLMSEGWMETIVPPEELYDLILDPQERNNLALGATHESTLAKFRGHLETWMRQTSDPLLEADPSGLPLPQKVNPSHAQHPGPPLEEWNPKEWDAIARKSISPLR